MAATSIPPHLHIITIKKVIHSFFIHGFSFNNAIIIMSHNFLEIIVMGSIEVAKSSWCR